MSLEQKLDDAIAAQNNLTQTVAAKMGQIDATTAAQQQAFTNWMNNAKNQFAAHSSRELFVGGSNNKWYPVVFSLPNRVLGRLNIGRYAHNDSDKYGMSNGGLNFSLDAVCGEWGGAPGRVIPNSYQYTLGAGFTNPFVADVGLDAYGIVLVVYLLGQRTYEIAPSWPCAVTALTADTNNPIYMDSAQPQYNVFKDAKTTVSTSMLPNNYLRGG